MTKSSSNHKILSAVEVLRLGKSNDENREKIKSDTVNEADSPVNNFTPMEEVIGDNDVEEGENENLESLDALRNQINELNITKGKLLKEIETGRKKPLHFNLKSFTAYKELLEKYSHAPSLDIIKRHDLIKIFYQPMTVDDIEDNTDINGIETLSFTMKFRYLMQFSIVIKLKDSKQTVQSLKIGIDKFMGPYSELDSIKDLQIESEERKDITLFINSINSYADLFTERLTTWMDLFAKYFPKSHSINGHVNEGSKNCRLLAYSILKRSSILEVTFVKKTVRIRWDLHFLLPNDGFSNFGKCESSISGSIFGSNSNPSVVNMTPTIDALVRTKNIYDACCSIMDIA